MFLLFSDLELKPVGRLEVKLVQAKELTNKDIIGKSDPFAVLYVRPIRARTKTSKTIVSYFSSFTTTVFCLVSPTKKSVSSSSEQPAESSLE